MTFTDLGGVGVSDPDKLVGITDIALVETSLGDVLFATGRGGSYLTSIALGSVGSASNVTEHWLIPVSYLQVESVEVISLPSTQGDGVYLAGLNSADLEGRHVEGDDIRYAIDLDAGPSPQPPLQGSSANNSNKRPAAASSAEGAKRPCAGDTMSQAWDLDED